MQTTTVIGILTLAGATVFAGQTLQRNGDAKTEKPADTVMSDDNPRGSIGPDIVCWEIYDRENAYFGSDGTYRGYAFGTISCNVGDERVDWIDFGPNSNRHPVIAQNMYSYVNGRFQQVGISWLKHGFTALDNPGCGDCEGWVGGDALGVGCEDPYWAGLNGSQSSLGPRYEVNATTGDFPFPPADPAGSGQTYRLCKVLHDDLEKPGAKFFIECHYVTHDDAIAGNGNNNASFREIQIASNGQVTGYGGLTNVRLSAINAWRTEDPMVLLRNAYDGNGGRLMIGSRAYDNGDGTWDYEYAVYNMNSDQSVRSFSVPLPSGVNVSNPNFHDVDYHSGEPFDGTDWTPVVASDSITWSTDEYSRDANANALRWGTLYNFRFTADSGPEDMDATLGMFKPGPSMSLTAQVRVPMPGMMDPCPWDFDDSSEVGTSDFFALLQNWGACPADPDPCPWDLDDSGDVGTSDFFALLQNWGTCP
jgi:hypothetical protein